MKKPIPINPLNAIEAMSFIVIFNREITQEEDSKLQTLKEKFKTDLPTFSQNTKLEAKFDGKIFTHDYKKEGVTLQHLGHDQKPTWVLVVNGNQVAVNCLKYDSWSKVWPKAKKFIRSTIETLDLENDIISAFSIQCIDKFTQENTEEGYTPFDIFKTNSKFLTPKSSSVGKLWHVHQGWFDKKSVEDKILNILNIGTFEQDNRLITAIDHVIQYRFKAPKSKAILKELDNYFIDLHNNNKSLIKSLLNSKQTKQIGLV